MYRERVHPRSPSEKGGESMIFLLRSWFYSFVGTAFTGLVIVWGLLDGAVKVRQTLEFFEVSLLVCLLATVFWAVLLVCSWVIESASFPFIVMLKATFGEAGVVAATQYLMIAVAIFTTAGLMKDIVALPLSMSLIFPAAYVFIWHLAKRNA